MTRGDERKIDKNKIIRNRCEMARSKKVQRNKQYSHSSRGLNTSTMFITVYPQNLSQ